MKKTRLPLLGLLIALGSSLSAEEVTLRQSAMLKADRSIVSLKPGTVVELVARDGDKLTIKYKNLTGTISADKIEEPKAAEPAKSEAPKPAEPKAKETPPSAEAPPAKQPPTTNYGKAVQKAKDNAAAHDKNIAKPTDEVMK
jgi:pyruvate/2-oxoglutarate dehydrogenase complex dihydrolipoamide acyltransferase (E2) component